VRVAFVVAERRKEHRLAKQIFLDTKKNRPERAVVPVSYQVTRMQDEIRNAVFHKLSDDPLMHIVSCPRVAIDRKTIRPRLPGRWRRFERPCSRISSAGNGIFVTRIRLQSRECRSLHS